MIPLQNEFKEQANPYTPEYAVSLCLRLMDMHGISKAIFIGEVTARLCHARPTFRLVLAFRSLDGRRARCAGVAQDACVGHHVTVLTAGQQAYLQSPERVTGLVLVSPHIFSEGEIGFRSLCLPYGVLNPNSLRSGFPDLVKSMFRTRLGEAFFVSSADAWVFTVHVLRCAGKEMVLQLVRTDMGEVAIRRAWYRLCLPFRAFLV